MPTQYRDNVGIPQQKRNKPYQSRKSNNGKAEKMTKHTKNDQKVDGNRKHGQTRLGNNSATPGQASAILKKKKSIKKINGSFYYDVPYPATEQQAGHEVERQESEGEESRVDKTERSPTTLTDFSAILYATQMQA
jgi:hypothetical protein